jgi:hypothetical protein
MEISSRLKRKRAEKCATFIYILHFTPSDTAILCRCWDGDCHELLAEKCKKERLQQSASQFIFIAQAINISEIAGTARHWPEKKYMSWYRSSKVSYAKYWMIF